MNLLSVDLSGAQAWRLIPTRVPSADLLARVANPTDYDLLNALDAQTNRRIQAFGHANLYVAAAFAYSLGGTPSRFNDGTWGTIYVGLEPETALEEVRFWQARYLKGIGHPLPAWIFGCCQALWKERSWTSVVPSSRRNSIRTAMAHPRLLLGVIVLPTGA